MRYRTCLLLGGLLAVAMAGCGGTSGGDGVASAGGTPSAAAASSKAKPDDAQAALAYAKCMRENGLPNFADPKINDNGEVQMELNGDGVDPQRMEAAQAKCKPLLPGGGEPQKLDPQRLEQLRKLAKCMRENGMPSFPDPTDQGIQINANEHPELDPTNPKFQAAEKACAQYQPNPGPNGGGSSHEMTS